MLYWQTLIAAADELEIDTDKKAAAAWATRYLYRPAKFDRREWDRWKRSFEALRWLTANRTRRRRVGIPPDVQQIINANLCDVRVDFSTGVLQDGLILRLARADGTPADNPEHSFGFPDDQRTVLSMAFLNYFGLLDVPNVCVECGSPVGPTKKLSKDSKARFCSSGCRVKHWRRQQSKKGE